MGRASTDLSASGHDAPLRRQRRGGRLRLRPRRRRSPTPTSDDPSASSQERSPPFSEASVSAPPSYIPSPDIHAGTYIAVAPLPVFRGDPGECPDAHLARFDRVCLANNATSTADAARIFPASLDADAALWYELTAPASSPPPWHGVRAAFVDFFRPPGAANRVRAELMALRQRPGEPVNRYHLRMQGILRRFPDASTDVPDAFLKSAFVHGLRAEFQDWVAPQHPEALDEAVALALSWEGAEGLREARRAAKAAVAGNDGVRCGFCGAEGHEEPGCEVRKRMMELWLRSSSSGRGSTMLGKMGDEAEEGGGSARLGRLGSAVSARSAQCQCRKHQCWKKAAPASEVAGEGEANGVAADK
ncbi:hypothetical protein D1007_36341 [Hordeum vulgare]|nr:hypothetical protein D1007_36341 [Hordeum vulgare]